MRREEEEGNGGELAGPRQRALPPLPACCQDAAPLPGLRRGQALAGAAAADGGGSGGSSGGRQRQAALETAAAEEEAEEEEAEEAELAMLLIHMSTGSPLLWEGASGLAQALRERGLLTGRPVGSQPRSNGCLGLPLQLLPEEAFLLTQRGLALMVGAAGAGEGGREGQRDLARARSKAEGEEGEWRSDLTEGGSEGERGMDPPETREELGEAERLRDLAEREREGDEEGERRRNPAERTSEGEEEGRSGYSTHARREGEKGHRGLTVGGSEGERCRDIVERMGEGEQEGRSGDPTDARTAGGGALDRSYGLQRYLALERRRRELSVHQLRIQSGRQIKRRREAQGDPGDAEPGQRERTGVGTDSPTPLGEPKGFTFLHDHCLVQIHTTSPLPRLLPALDWQLDHPLPSSPLPRAPSALNWCPDCPQSPRTAVAKDLRQRGYHITAGGKFGGDFLVYPGEAALFHAHFIAMCVRGEKALPLRELLTAGRLACNVNKSVLLCSRGRERRGGAGEEGASLIYTSLGWSGIQ